MYTQPHLAGRPSTLARTMYHPTSDHQSSGPRASYGLLLQYPIRHLASACPLGGTQVVPRPTLRRAQVGLVGASVHLVCRASPLIANCAADHGTPGRRAPDLLTTPSLTEGLTATRRNSTTGRSARRLRVGVLSGPSGTRLALAVPAHAANGRGRRDEHYWTEPARRRTSASD